MVPEERPSLEIDRLLLPRVFGISGKTNMKKPAGLFAIFLISMTLGPAWASDGCLDLTEAVMDGNTQRAKQLIASGVSVNCSFTDSHVNEDSGETYTHTSTPLNIAAGEGYLNAVRFLLGQGANVNTRDGAGHTPLYNVDDQLFFLEMMWASDEEFEEAEAIYDLLKRAGGVMSE